MLEWMPAAWRTEMDELAQRYGAPLARSVTFADEPSKEYLRRTTRSRQGEVCMVIRQHGKLLTMTKTFYPRGVYRLPTGGIESGEGIAAALHREMREETGLEVEIEQFLCALEYLDGDAACFASFAFLLRVTGGTLGPLDPHERVLDFREASVSDLSAIARQLEHLDATFEPEIGSRWSAWGVFRAPLHSAVHERLSG
jgi:ADP-ribose pyrophosphatase YjhB (NUDIX family)